METINYLSRGTGLYLMAAGLALVFFAAVFVIMRSSWKVYAGRLVFPLFFILISIGFFIQALSIKGRLGDTVGPAIVPMLWLSGITILSLFILLRTVLGHEEKDPEWGRTGIVAAFLISIILYLYVIIYIGYFIATFLFLSAGIYFLSYRNWKVIILLSSGWIVFSYVAFYRILYVPLPKGILIERIFG